jgi:hypothetical protein
VAKLDTVAASQAPPGEPCAECGRPVQPGRPTYRTYRWRRLTGGEPPVREPLLVCGPGCLGARRAVNLRARLLGEAPRSAP